MNAAEFFVTTAISITFFLTMDFGHWNVVLGLVIGGVMAAPLAGLLSARLPERLLMLMVAGIVVTLSVGLVRLVA